MADAEVGRQELPVESYIFQLSSVKLLTEEGQRSPTAAVTAVLPLLENCTDVGVAGVDGQADLRLSSGFGCVRVFTAASVSLMSWKMCCMAGAHTQSQSALSASVRGKRMFATAGMNRQ